LPFFIDRLQTPILEFILNASYHLSRAARLLPLTCSCLLLLAGSPAVLAKNTPAKTAAPAPAFASRQAALAALPPLMLWVWERPDDTRSWLANSARTSKSAEADDAAGADLQTQRIGVAVLDTTVLLRDGSATVRRRQQALDLPPDWSAAGRLLPKAPLVTIVHVDMATGAHKPALNERQKQTIVRALTAAAKRSPSQVVQLDFEVMHSQKPFLANVIQRSRAALPDNVALSITAQASWCVGDAWLADLPVDEIVPMAFRMSGDVKRTQEILIHDGRFPRPECQPSLGLALNEQPWPDKLRSQRLYLFNRAAWSATPMASWSVRLGAFSP
jgi:RNase H-fold protein (predicted Holliday junction resolvase)